MTAAATGPATSFGARCHIAPRGRLGLRILFIHGAGAQDSDDGSQPLLRGLRDALPRESVVDAPVMPDADHPDAAAWDRAVREHMAAIDEDFVAVGHSLGGSTILREISEQGASPNLRGVVTLAMPFWNAPDWQVPDYAVPEDSGRLKDVQLVLYASTDDETVAIHHLDRYGANAPRCRPQARVRNGPSLRSRSFRCDRRGYRVAVR